jgi:hypothetical protein
VDKAVKNIATDIKDLRALADLLPQDEDAVRRAVARGCGPVPAAPSGGGERAGGSATPG